ncbi:hypothetical protein GZH47_00860 [Paenibacillus rhizovicinus]|uniref:Helix-turn-helix domain-containing protein n=1 Tax=Paenibacillus rhizovicinus TaxID=2704463 RepID=A0A6C0NTJ6_9BACL|nr:hypothetical protein [Paenibacillus rhizovicinus]QHW29524.1 hypothetical protein GZH47_00860 [Paenibacillus rhizovicinus]
MTYEPLFTVEEVAIMLNKEKRIIYQWLAAGTLQGKRKNKGRRSRWEIPASTVKPLIPGRLSEHEKAVLDITAKLLACREEAASESSLVLLDDLLLHFLSLQDEHYEIEAAREEERKHRCRNAGIAANDCVGWDKLALHQLISKNQHGAVSDAELSDILISNEWVAAYEYLTNEIVLVREAE